MHTRSKRVNVCSGIVGKPYVRQDQVHYPFCPNNKETQALGLPKKAEEPTNLMKHFYKVRTLGSKPFTNIKGFQ